MPKFFNNLLFFVLLGIALESHAQNFISSGEPGKQKFTLKRENLFFGGQLGLMFGSNTDIYLAPEAGYRFTPKLGLGAGITYRYLSENDIYRFNTSIYGGKLFGYYVFFDNLFGYAEFQSLSLESKYYNPLIYPQSKRFTVSSLLAGPGYRYRAGEHSYLKIMILWNLIQNSYIQESNPVVRFSIEF